MVQDNVIVAVIWGLNAHNTLDDQVYPSGLILRHVLGLRKAHPFGTRVPLFQPRKMPRL